MINPQRDICDKFTTCNSKYINKYSSFVAICITHQSVINDDSLCCHFLRNSMRLDPNSAAHALQYISNQPVSQVFTFLPFYVSTLYGTKRGFSQDFNNCLVVVRSLWTEIINKCQSFMLYNNNAKQSQGQLYWLRIAILLLAIQYTL